MNDTAVPPRHWYVAKYPALAWAETLIKASAILIGIVALATSLTKGAFVWPAGARLVEFAVLAILAIGLVAAIFDRFVEREIVAMIFILLNNLAHWGVVASVLYVSNRNPYLVPFCALMTVGDMVKTIFLKAHSFQVRNVPQFMLFTLTAIYITGYLVVLLVELMR
ncbi:MAG: hypothetical protein HY231_12800 [Acidobacteria bacterium]|nr:hypothetical protein [Acidobacteriota bacterium]